MLLEMKRISIYVSFDKWQSSLYAKAEKEGNYIQNVLAQSLEDVEMYLYNPIWITNNLTDVVISNLQFYISIKLFNFRLLVGCLSFLKAFACICLILSRVTAKSCPTSSRV